MRFNGDESHRRRKLLGREGRGPPTFLPLWTAPISGPPTFERHLNITYNITAVLHSHYNVLTSTDIENGIVCCGSVYTTGVDGFTASVNGPRHGSTKIFLLPPSKSFVVVPLCLTTLQLTTCPAHPLFSCFRRLLLWVRMPK